MVTDYDYYADGEAAPGLLEKQISYYGGQAETQAVAWFGYDGLGRRDWTADAAENQVFTTYNNMGRVTRRQTIENNGLGDPNNTLTTDYVYDKFGNMVEQRQIPDPDEPGTYLATAFEYDCRGLLIKRTLPEGAITTFDYNAWGLKTEQIADVDGIDQKTEYGYSRLGRQTTITGYADGSTAQTTSYDLDNLGRVETITYPDANSIAYVYYPQGTVKKRTDQRNLATYYEYDHVGNLVKKTVSFDGSDYEETFTYDGLGRMTEAAKYRDTTTHIATSEFEYNSFSKVTEATETILDADAVEIGYDYDQLGNLTGITYPDANDVTITREALGRIDTITLDGDTIASYKYIGGRVKRRSYNSPSVTYDINYNGLGQATRHYTYKSGADITDFVYEYDDNGNITKQEFNHRTSTPYNDYDYDDLDRLTDADYLIGVLTEDEQFTYDDLGNRTNVNLRSGSDESYSVNNLTNRYNSVGGNSLNYDEAGNLTQDPNGYEYEYDYENRLIEITRGETTIAQYEYDALGRRIEKTDSVANETTRYYYDNEWRVLAEFDDNDTQLRDYIYGNYIDEVLVMTDSDEEQYYYAHNHIYSVVALIDDQGNVLERYEYNAYGMPTIYNTAFSQTYDTSQYENPYLFTGRHMDSLDSDAHKLGFNRNRYIDYYTGRWLSHDPEGYVDGLNLYEYVRSNTTLYTDPYGFVHYLENDPKKRSKKKRVRVILDPGDKGEDVAKFMGLDYHEMIKWANMAKCGFEVPNTAYIDVDFYSWGVLGYQTKNMKKDIEKGWKARGWHVIYTGPKKTTLDTARSHLRDKDLIAYMIIAHGDEDEPIVGRIEFIDKDGSKYMPAGKRTSFGIKMMVLVVCYSDKGADKWISNISSTGVLMTIKGKLRSYNWRWQQVFYYGNPNKKPKPDTIGHPKPEDPNN